MGCGGLTLRSNEMIQHVCRYALYVRYCISVLDLVVDEMDGRTRYLLRYGTVWYYLWAEKGCLYVCVRARVLGWAVLVRCGAGFIVGV